MISSKLSSKKVVLCAISLFIIAIVAALYSSISKKPTEDILSNKESESIKTDLPEAIEQDIVLKNITIHTGLTEEQLHPGQYAPYELKTANGHYIIKIADDSQKIEPKMIYDGNTIVVDGEVTSIGISRNGLHYAFVVNQSDLYIDGKKTASDVQIDSPQVTDDGQHYFYLFRESRDEFSSVYYILKKDGSEIYSHDDGIFAYQISHDGKHYLAELRNRVFAGNYGSIISLDGANFSSNRNVKQLILSNNGEHYGYILGGEGLDTNSDGVTTQFGKEDLYVDGKKILESRVMYSLRVMDSGDYAVSAPDDRTFYTSKKNIPMKSDSDGALLVFINNNLDNYLVSDGKWYLDDKEVEVKDGGDLVELTDSSIFVYEITQ